MENINTCSPQSLKECKNNKKLISYPTYPLSTYFQNLTAVNLDISKLSLHTCPHTQGKIQICS